MDWDSISFKDAQYANMGDPSGKAATKRKANAHLYPEKPGPGRLAMFAALGLAAGADRARLKAAA